MAYPSVKFFRPVIFMLQKINLEPFPVLFAPNRIHFKRQPRYYATKFGCTEQSKRKKYRDPVSALQPFFYLRLRVHNIPFIKSPKDSGSQIILFLPSDLSSINSLYANHLNWRGFIPFKKMALFSSGIKPTFKL